MDGTPYLIAGYLVTWIALAWYAWRLHRRTREARRALEWAPEVPDEPETVS